MRRRFLILLCALVAVLVLSVAALPWWLGAALRSAGGSRGLTFARYERIGYSRFALHEAEFRHARVRVTATRLEADTPLVARWRRGQIAVGRWTVEVLIPADRPVSQKTESGWVPLRTRLLGIARQLDRWAPRVTTEAGIVRWPGTELGCASASWTTGSLALQGVAYRGLKADATVAFAADALRLGLQTANGGINAESRGADVTGAITWWEQRAELRSRFGERGWLPAEATLNAADWNVPGEKLRIGTAYGVVRGHGKIDWREGQFSADLAATGEPVQGKSVPPLEVTLRGRGDTGAFTVEALSATLPGIVARLSEAVTVERSGRFRQSGARFTLEADLSKQPWFTATGVVQGEARLESVLGQEPVLDFQLAARDLKASDWTASLVEAKGQFVWPRVNVTSGTLAGTAGERLQWRGGWDFATKELLSATADGEIRRATVARWLPAELEFAAVTIKAEAAGTVAELKHTGRAQAEGVKFRAVNPSGVNLTWTGQGAKVASFAAEVTTGATRTVIEGAVDGDAVRLEKLEWLQGGASRLRLTEPAGIRWRPTWQVDALHLMGPEGAVDAKGSWGETGQVEVAVKNFSSAWLSDFGVLPGPAWRLTSLAAKGDWDRGPMTFSLTSTVAIDMGAERSAVLAIAARGDTKGLQLDGLSVVEGEKSVVKAVGRIPLRLRPGAKPILEIEAEGALALDVTTEPNAGFWQQWSTLTGFELKEPEATAQVTGTWARPQGTVRVKAARVAVDATRFKRPMPTMEALDIELAGAMDEVRLERLTVTIEGQAVRARGRLPVTERKWREFLGSPLLWAQRGAEGELEVTDADLAALARFLPVFVAPKGRLQMNVTYKDGALGGALHLRDAATRPLGPLGVLQDINAEVAFAGRKMELRTVTAQSGGQTVTLSGSVELPEKVATTRTTPDAGGGLRTDALKYEVALKGENLPFVRQTGVLVRGDVDLKLTSPVGEAPQIAGTVRLRESLFLSDVRALLPGGARTKSRVPPYFAVETAPYDAWRLDVLVQGERFLKLRTALFNGLASARIQLSGTLGEPLARGEATIDEGIVKLPFATFVVQEGRVSLNPEQGVEPQVWLVGTVRRLSHDLRMEASGPASAPILVFSSTPPLESGQVLLMVMAGESPRESVTFSERQRMARLGTFLGQSLVASLGGESETGERLSISTGENVSRQGRETYVIEYRVGDRWSLVGEYDEFDEYNAGVKWRVFSKGGTREERKK